MTIDDETIRASVAELLRLAFSKLNIHTHGPDRQGQLLAEVQGNIAAAARGLIQLDQGDRPETTGRIIRQLNDQIGALTHALTLLRDCVAETFDTIDESTDLAEAMAQADATLANP